MRSKRIKKKEGNATSLSLNFKLIKHKIMKNKITKTKSDFPSFKTKTFFLEDLDTGEQIECANVRGWTRYGATKDGRIFSLKTGKIIKPRDNGSGYLVLKLYREGFNQMLYVHRIVYEAFNLYIPRELEINHLNGIKTDNRLENLDIVNRSENLKHAYEIGLMKKGGEHPNAIAVIQIDKTTFKVLHEYETLSEASAKTGISLQNISGATKGKLKTAGGFIWCKRGEWNPQINAFQLQINFN